MGRPIFKGTAGNLTEKGNDSDHSSQFPSVTIGPPILMSLRVRGHCLSEHQLLSAMKMTDSALLHEAIKLSILESATLSSSNQGWR
jgi:hypothetical protein